ncbi:MAG: hypothetical protein CVV22_04610 [Ignavibacteriae bacterium HGW-Ignavibacteriae-1]|jgi:hypothetical protein|nr:MAG: hypothetical protein CVV22_04610 [Ignavibacteriae bacterium HGW-Ignavibacteriae-1]
MKTLTIFVLFFIFINHGYSDWEPCSGLPDNSETLSQFMKVNDDVLHIGTISGLHVSMNNGDSWNFIGFNSRVVYDIAFPDDKLIVATSIGIFLSADMGQNWTLKMNGISDSNPNVIKNIYSCENFVLASKIDRKTGPKYGNYLYISKDYGDNWVEIGSVVRDLPILELYVHDCNIYAVTYYKIYFSRDEGKTWDTFLEPFTEFDSFTKIAIHNDCIYIFDVYRNIYISLDKGVTWKTRELLHKAEVIVSVTDSIVFISTYSNGVYFSTNNGDNWIGPIKINNPIWTVTHCINSEYVFVIEIPNDQNLPRIYRIKTSDLGVLASVPSEITESTFSIHPNPATEYITIQTSEVLETSAVLEVKILNMLGEIVLSVNLESQSNRIDVSSLTPGMYFISIGNKVQKFIKL